MNSLERLYNTRMFLPAWWVDSYDNALKADLEQKTTLEEATMLPLADAHEVYVQSFLLAQIQTKILEGSRAQALTLDLSDIEKQVYRKGFRSRFIVPKVVYSAGSMKLLERKGDKYHCIPMFQDSSFQKRMVDKVESWQIELAPNWQYWDAFFGYVLSYEELFRSHQRVTPLYPILQGLRPLCIWRSIWLDLQGVEQGLFLRMEKAVHWEDQCVHWQGVFASSLKTIFRNFSFGNQKLFATNIARQFASLERLSQKLVDHGYLAGQIPAEYLILGAEQDTAQFVWKLSNTRFLADDYVDLQRFLCRYYLMHRLPQQAHAFNSFFLESEQGINFSQIMAKISALLPEEASFDLSLVIDQNTILPLIMLFAEWMLRLSPAARYPLPEGVKKLDGFVHVEVAAKNLSEFRAQFQNFAQKILANPHAITLFQTEPFATMVSLVSFQQMRKTQDLKPQVAVREEAVQQPIKAEPEKAQESLKESMSETRLAMALAQTKNVAQGELDRMKVKDHESYLRLTNAYIESLDTHSQKLILDIKQKMQPKIFDHHIKQRLLQFMVDHPGKWQHLGKDARH